MARKKPARLNQKFTKIVPLKNGETCTSLKRHYKNCAREVIGYLESVLKHFPDEERFVWAHVATIVKRCNKHRKSKAPYKQRAVEYALTFLRGQLVLTPTERVRRGVLRQGWILAHHDAITVAENGCCELQGQRHWEREIETERDASGQWIVKKIGPVIWPAVRPSVRPENPSVRPTVRPTVRLEYRTVSTQPNEEQPLTKPERALALSAVLPEEKDQTYLTCASGQETKTEKGKTNYKTEGGEKTGLTSSDTTDQKLESIAQHFADWPDNYRDAIVTISTGLIIDEIGKSDISAVANGLRFHNWQELAACCRAIVDQHGGAPYLGRKTHGDVMAWGMRLFKQRHGINTPPCWYAVAKTLRAYPVEKTFVYENDWQAEHERHNAAIVAEEIAKRDGR